MSVQLPGGAVLENWTNTIVTFIDEADGLRLDIPLEGMRPAFVDIRQKGTDWPFIWESTFAGSNLPEPRKGVFLIVLPVLKIAYPDRTDLVTPIGAVRDSSGARIGYKGFTI